MMETFLAGIGAMFSFLWAYNIVIGAITLYPAIALGSLYLL